ncbi:MAG: pantoate--beta-alanine ligase [Verrucomicrobiota bacterium]
MRIMRTIAAMQSLAKKSRIRGVSIGFVPTMGYLHAGHISLVSRARKAIGNKGLVVVSIYVNPTQFAPTEDLAKYPRDFNQDKKLCRAAGVDVLFAPTDHEMYPADFSTYVSEEKLSRGMEGASRPTHFRGVTTIVAKLFNIVLPDVSVFGAKDFQQAAVVQRMQRDLNFPGKTVVAPTYREPDGLALSSRNRYLSPVERQQATILWRAMQDARQKVKTGSIPAKKLKDEIQKLVSSEAGAKLDYVEFFHPETLETISAPRRGTQMALAVRFGKTRLIDNSRL